VRWRDLYGKLRADRGGRDGLPGLSVIAPSSHTLVLAGKARMRLSVPTEQARHLLCRFSYGITPEMLRNVEALGGGEHWFRRQLAPGQVADGFASNMRSWFPYLAYPPSDLWHAQQTGLVRGWDVMMNFVQWTLLRRTFSRRQLHEVMSDFWSNLLHVAVPDDGSWPHRIGYDSVIRQNALGRFDDLLVAAVTHPAMGGYLDNAKSTATRLNENLGRELLELHTVGRESGFGEVEVKDSARILTGFRVDLNDTWRPYYSPGDHFVGHVSVLGFSAANAEPDGRAVTRAYLRYLAYHPATAQRISRRLCVQFVSDDPSPDLIAVVASAYTASGTDIKATLRALVTHSEFARSVGHKVRTPSEDAVATYRALGIRMERPELADDFLHAMHDSRQLDGPTAIRVAAARWFP